MEPTLKTTTNNGPIVCHQEPLLSWTVNNQVMVTGSQYRLTCDGMHHLICPNCHDAGRVEVHAHNLLGGDCVEATELRLKRKVDDYCGAVTNAPSPWYDEQTLKVYYCHHSPSTMDGYELENSGHGCCQHDTCNLNTCQHQHHHQQQQRQVSQQQQLAITERANSAASNQSFGSNRQSQQQQQQQQQYQQNSFQSQNQTTQQQQQVFHQQQQQQQQQLQDDLHSQRNLQNRSDRYQNYEETLSSQRQEQQMRERQVQQQQQVRPQQQQQAPQTYTQQPQLPEEPREMADRSPRGNTRLVKRWDWNQAQFVTSEVPVSPVPRQLPATQHARGPTDVWHQQVGEATAPQTSSDVSAEQPWLAHRIPDVQSIQTDPVYRDFMLELARLEEGVAAPPPEPPAEQETCRPTFGQPVTPSQIEVKEYESAEFVCRLIPISDPLMRVQWTVNGRPLQESSRITNEHEFGVVRLRINRCEAEDSGVYQCRASNALGEAISTGSLRVHAKGSVQCETLHPLGLEQIRALENPKQVEHNEEPPVEQAPKFLTHIVDYVEKDEGESVHFECCLSPVDDPHLRTEWFFNGRPLVTGSRFHTIDDFGFIVLDIDWLFPRDTGEYVCRATNRHGSDLTRTVLRVRPDKKVILDSQLDNPMIIDKLRQLEFPDVPQEVQVEEPERAAHFVQHLRSAGNRRHFVEGDNVHFEARVGPASDGQLTVEWFHNEKPLISGHRFKPAFDFGHIQLDILYVYPEDSGVYKCVTRNAAGTDVSQFEIQVSGKQSIVYQSQLPKEMVGGVQKITDMEAQWNKPPEPEEDEEPAPRCRPEFVLRPKPCVAFEGSCARFCCRLLGHPKPRLTWTVNGQVVVTGSRYKLTYDGMHHLIIPKCQLSDAGRIEVHARNLLGECLAATELKVKRKVDDYRGVLKNSPNPWYDEQSLKVYQRHRSSVDEDDGDDIENNGGGGGDVEQRLLRLQMAAVEQSSSPLPNQVIGYMEPGTPDVNLLLTRNQSPLVEPGDLHPLVAEQQVVMAPAPSTVGRALEARSKLPVASPGRSFQQQSRDNLAGGSAQDLSASGSQQHVFGLDSTRHSSSEANAAAARSSLLQSHHQQHQQQQVDYQEWLRQQQVQQQQQQQRQSEERLFQRQQSPASSLSSQQQQMFDPRLPPPSPESVVHGKERHSHTHKQTQKERRANREIKREIIEKETFEQEHKGVTKETVHRGASAERGSTPDSLYSATGLIGEAKHLQDRLVWLDDPQQHQQHQQGGFSDYDSSIVSLDENAVPPEFINKIQPCQALDGDEAKFECTFRGEPAPTISWYRETKLIRPSNLYSISCERGRSTLIIRRVTMNANAVYTVKAENSAGSAKSSANLVVEPHPLPDSGRRGQARVVRTESKEQSPSGDSGEVITTTTTTSTSTTSAGDTLGADESSDGSKVVRSVTTRKLQAQEMADLIRGSPEGLLAPAFVHTIHEISSKPGELARLDARLVGSQPMEVRWLKDGQRLRADRSHKMLLEGDLYTLLILECSQRDAGFYECVASNRVGEARCGANLTLTNGRPSSSAAAVSGGGGGVASSSTFSATTTTTGNSSSSSSKKGVGAAHQQTASTINQSSSNNNNNNNNPSTTDRRHFGLTKHQYNPLMTQYTAAGAVQRQPEVSKLIKGLENQVVCEGKSVTLRCQISSFPIPEVHWLKGEKLIKPSKYFRIFKDNDETYCLRILEAFPEDQGEYRCVSRAPNGQVYVETKATVTVIPTSPK